MSPPGANIVEKNTPSTGRREFDATKCLPPGILQEEHGRGTKQMAIEIQPHIACRTRCERVDNGRPDVLYTRLGFKKGFAGGSAS